MLFCSSLFLYVFIVYLYFVFSYCCAASYGAIKNDDKSVTDRLTDLNLVKIILVLNATRQWQMFKSIGPDRPEIETC